MNIWLELDDPNNGKKFHTHFSKEKVKKELIELVYDALSKSSQGEPS